MLLAQLHVGRFMNRKPAPLRNPFADRTGRADANCEALLDAAPDAMVIVDQQGRIAAVNCQTETMFGYGRSELLGRPVEALLPERFVGAHVDHRHDYSAHPRVRPMGIGLELYGRRKDGSEFPVEIGLSPLQTVNGVYVTSAIRDVTQRAAADAEIRKLNQDLQEALTRSERLAASGRLMATIAHEINNPLASLTNLLYLLQGNATLDQPTQELVRMAQREVGVLANISRHTLLAHRETRLPVVTRISELLDDACALFAPKLHKAGIGLVRQFETEGEVTVYPSDLRQVFTNLIANAIDAMPRGGELRAAISPAAGGVSVAISDTGYGIPAEHLAKIYEPFFTTKGERGTGIGLWVIKNILAKLGGRIEVTSSTEAGRSGTCFTIFVPAVVRSEPEGDGLIGEQKYA